MDFIRSPHFSDLYPLSFCTWFLKNKVQRTGFLVYFELDFYCLGSLQKSSSSNLILQTRFFKNQVQKDRRKVSPPSINNFLLKLATFFIRTDFLYLELDSFTRFEWTWWCSLTFCKAGKKLRYQATHYTTALVPLKSSITMYTQLESVHDLSFRTNSHISKLTNHFVQLWWVQGIFNIRNFWQLIFHFCLMARIFCNHPKETLPNLFLKWSNLLRKSCCCFLA